MENDLSFWSALPWLAAWTLSIAWLLRQRIIGPHATLHASHHPIRTLDGAVAVLLALGGGAMFSFLAQRLQLHDTDTPLAKAALVAAGQLALLGVPALYALALHLRHRPHPAPPDTTSTILLITATGCLLTITLGQGTVALSAWIGSLAGYPAPSIAHRELQQMIALDDPAALAIRLASAILIAPLLEEAVFRGLIQRAFHAALGSPWPAILLTALTFGVIHLGVVPYQGLLGLVILGVIFGWLYARTQRLWVAILAHALFNAFNVAMAFAFYATPATTP